MHAVLERTRYGMSPDRVEWHLWNWQRWMESTALYSNLDLPDHGCMGDGYRSMDRDNDSAYEEADRFAGAAVQAALEDLPSALRIAVYIVHEIALYTAFRDVYRIREDVDVAYDRAKLQLGARLDIRGLS